ncbi:MAG: phytanoyl-CoA dioxygenase family protein [Alphaproteobacteria bacterium]|nr:phytanoyl-CoA dioxygenase family protein [Alphaproteobacteria bacterium]MBU2306015.1 phytanoyl-CoA dioxygenase family protein [Alphaproteobacteria bacterium]
MRTQGWSRFDSVVPEPELKQLRAALDDACAQCREVQLRNGLPNTEGTAHHVLVFEGPFMDFLTRYSLDAQIEAFFQSQYILNSFGAVVTHKDAASYAMNLHRDVRTFTGELKLILNMLVMLDDFTLENGATHLLTGSHARPDRPSPEAFARDSDRLTGKAGTICLFDSNLWHAAGQNRTDTPRRAITLTFSKAMIKPQFDFIRFFGEERVVKMEPRLRQMLGWDARVPASLDEWYQPVERRLYKPGQD